jgi:arabinofuranosyltransferase
MPGAQFAFGEPASVASFLAYREFVSRMRPDTWVRTLRGAHAARLSAAGVLLLSAAGLYWGWLLYWFMTDDAFIAFRFIANRRLGYGYTWNPPPFLPVEGYTSFSWVVLLDGVWTVFGIEPPDAANYLSLACSFGTLAVVSWASHRLCQLHGIAKSAAAGVTAAVLFATVSQRSFLVWSSGGLETALFNLLLQSWALVGLLALLADRVRPRMLASFCALASGIALTRPDGLLPVAASVAVVGLFALLRVVQWRVAIATAAPLTLVAAHLLFRHAFYGEWLPNTYYAKVVAPWPAAGARYLAAYGLEYAYYLALPLWFGAGWAWLRDGWRAASAADGVEARRARLANLGAQVLVIGTLLALLGFDVFVAGGDHFEYRMLSFTVPLCALAFVRGGFGLGLRGPSTSIALAGFSLISAVLPWTAFMQEGTRYAWPASPAVQPLAADVPVLLRPVAERFDALERWLIPRGIGVRHYEHRAFWLHQVRNYPTRERAARACSQADHPVAAIATIGIAGWVLEGCAVIDLRGLADYVIARSPGKLEYLGHDRKPPADYVRSFQPNLLMNDGRFVIYPRNVPLTDDRIRTLERVYRDKLRAGAGQAGLLP